MRVLTIAALGLTVMLVVAVSGCTSALQGQPTSGVSEPRQNEESGVTVTAVYKGNGSFDMKLDTHSGDLDYQLDKIAYVRDSSGTVYRPVSWEGGIGGHHFNGTLKFPKFDDSPGFRLVVNDVAGIKERVLQW